ncbi:unnamed protein product [Camellia sinensis]
MAHRRRFPMALVRNTADLIRLLPALAIVLNLAFLPQKNQNQPAHRKAKTNPHPSFLCSELFVLMTMAHRRRFPMALVRNTADLIRLLPALAIVLNLAFLSPEHLRSTYDGGDSCSFPLLPSRISSLFGRRWRLC